MIYLLFNSGINENNNNNDEHIFPNFAVGSNFDFLDNKNDNIDITNIYYFDKHYEDISDEEFNKLFNNLDDENDLINELDNIILINEKKMKKKMKKMIYQIKI